jgi:hypothetical protein
LSRNLAKLTIDTGAGADLILPLGRHDLSVDTGDVDTGVQTGTVVSLDDITAVDLAGTDTAVVRTLGTGETATGPAVGHPSVPRRVYSCSRPNQKPSSALVSIRRLAS